MRGAAIAVLFLAIGAVAQAHDRPVEIVRSPTNVIVRIIGDPDRTRTINPEARRVGVSVDEDKTVKQRGVIDLLHQNIVAGSIPVRP